MKTKLYFKLILLCTCSFFVLSGCVLFLLDEEDELRFADTTYTPIYMSVEEFEAALGVEAPRELKQTGKIYSYKQYIFMNETYKGVHIIDNSDPTEPAIVGFINIPGNIDIAIKNDILYADSAIDLIAMDISNPLEAYTAKRINSIFPPIIPPDNGFFVPDESQGIIVGWEQ